MMFKLKQVSSVNTCKRFVANIFVDRDKKKSCKYCRTFAKLCHHVLSELVQKSLPTKLGPKVRSSHFRKALCKIEKEEPDIF